MRRAAAMRAAAQLWPRGSSVRVRAPAARVRARGASVAAAATAPAELVGLGDYDATLQAANRECVRLRNTVEGQLRELTRTARTR